jgi:hypothetical protein
LVCPELPEGHGAFLPFGIYGILASMPFAVWLFLAIEQLPLAAEESVDPRRDMPKGIMLGMFTLIALGFLVLIFNPAIPVERQITDSAGAATTVHGAFALGTSSEPILDGFRAIFGMDAAGKLVSGVSIRAAELPCWHDDQVDALGLVGQLLDQMVPGQAPKKPEPPKPSSGYRPLSLAEAPLDWRMF